MISSRVKELIAIGASVSANCRPCIKYHIGKAREVEIEEKEIQQAVAVGKMVRQGAASRMDEFLSSMIGDK